MNEDTATKLLNAISEIRDMLTLIEDEVNSIEAAHEDGGSLALIETVDGSPLWDSSALLDATIRRYHMAYNAYEEATSPDKA